MRNLVEPPTSRCHFCNGELRLKLVETSSAPRDKDIEVFVCASCGRAHAYAVMHDHYAAHTANKKPPAKTA